MTLRYASKCCIIELTRWMASSMAKIGPWQSLHQWYRKRPRMTWICCQQWCCLMMGVLLISWERDWAQTHPVIQGSFWFCCVSEDFWLLNLWSMFVNLFKWLLLKAFQATSLFMFLHFLQNVPSPRDQLGNWKRAQLVKMYSSGCQPLTTCNLPKKEAFANGTWGMQNFPRYRWDCDIFWSTRRVEMLGKPEAPWKQWKHQLCTHHFSSKKHQNQIWNGDYYSS